MISTEAGNMAGVLPGIGAGIPGPGTASAFRPAWWGKLARGAEADDALIQREGQHLRRMARDLATPQGPLLKPEKLAIAEAALVVTGVVPALLQGSRGLPPASHDTQGPGPRLADMSGLSGAASDAMMLPATSAPGTAHDVPGAARATAADVIERLAPGQAARENKHVIALLKKHNAEIFHDRLAISKGSLAKAAIDFLREHPDGDKELSREILFDRDHADGTEEPSAVVSEWLSRQFFTEGVENFIVAYLRTREDPADVSSAGLHDALSKRIYDTILIDAGAEPICARDANIKHEALERVVYRYAPVLQYARTGEWTDPARPEWGKINAGLLWVLSQGGDIRNFSEDEALAQGSLMLIANALGKASVEEQQMFLLAARCHAALGTIDSEAAGIGQSGILASYFAFNEKFIEQDCPFFPVRLQSRDFLTRTQLAQQRIDRECPQMSVDVLLNTSSEALCLPLYRSMSMGKYLLRPSTQRKLKHIFGEKIVIKSVNHDYQKQVDQLSASYLKQDKIRIFTAFSSLGEQELRFIDKARLQKIQAIFDARHTVFRQSAAANPEIQATLRVGMAAEVDIYAARTDDEERIYALHRTGQGYVARRIDRDASAYLLLAENTRPKNDPDYRLKILGEGEELQQRPGEMLDQLLARISGEHQRVFAIQVYALGFDQTTLQKVEGFVSSLLPFYTCISEGRKGNAEAILACTIDAAMLFSMVGQAGRAVFKTGDALIRSGLMAIRSSSAELAARNAVGLGTLARLPAAALPDSIAMRELSAQATGRDSVAELDDMLELGHSLKSYLPALETALPKFKPLQRLALIRRQGLSGGHDIARLAQQAIRPAPEAGPSMWVGARNSNAVTVNARLLRILRGGAWTEQEMAWFASEHRVDLHQLTSYIGLDGRLTEQGQRVVDQADMLEAGSSRAQNGGIRESAALFSDEIAEWYALNRRQRIEGSGIRGFSSRHRIDPISFEHALAGQRRPQLPAPENGLAAARAVDVPLTGDVLHDWLAWVPEHGASNESIIRFWNGRSVNLLEWVRHVDKDGTLTALGQDLLDRRIT